MEFPTPSPEDEKHLFPPYTGISFSYVIIDPIQKKATMIQETMLAEQPSKKYPLKLMQIVFGETTITMTAQQVRFVVKSWLSVLVAQGELIESKRNPKPPRSEGNIQSV